MYRAGLNGGQSEIENTYVPRQSVHIAEIKQHIEHSIVLGTLMRNFATLRSTLVGQLSRLIEVDTAVQQVARVHDILRLQVEAGRPIGEQRHVVGQRPGTTAVIVVDVVFAQLLVARRLGDLEFKVAHGEQPVDLEQRHGQIVLDALHYKVRVFRIWVAPCK